MTEVEAVLPESGSLPAPASAPAQSSAAEEAPPPPDSNSNSNPGDTAPDPESTNASDCPAKEEKGKASKDVAERSSDPDTTAPMDADAEGGGDDAQITSSTENGGASAKEEEKAAAPPAVGSSSGGGGDGEEESQAVAEPDSALQSSKAASDAEADVEAASSTACDSVSQNCDSSVGVEERPTESGDAISKEAAAEVSSDEKASESTDATVTAATPTTSEAMEVTSPPCDSSDAKVSPSSDGDDADEEEEEEGAAATEAKVTQSEGSKEAPAPPEPMEVDDKDEEEEQEAAEKAAKKAAPSIQKENGVASEAEMSRSQEASAVVDLDDDTDSEDDDIDEDEEDDVKAAAAAAVPKKPPQRSETSNGSASAAALAAKLPIDVTAVKIPPAGVSTGATSDSDGAVVIGSDSESDICTPTKPLMPATTQATASLLKMFPPPSQMAATSTPTHVSDDDDDDDDCVVIEDDSPPGPLPSSDLIKRKSHGLDADNCHEDAQPPSKRQRGGMPSGMSQITIKDARSLMPQDPLAKRPEINVYPVTITPATSVGGVGGMGGINQGPPKLVPMNVGGPVANISLLPGVINNQNLLPGLTDDMFVLEAPSFIVPYIYEKPPGNTLKDVVKDIESRFNLTQDDLAEADKSDEFDMITEQNKEKVAGEKTPGDKEKKKKKKRRGRDDGDDSWSETTEEDEEEDDDDSDAEVRTKVLIKEATDDLTALKGAIKPAAAVVQSPAAPNALAGGINCKPGQENYFENPLGKFFMDIGVGLVQEFVQSDLIRLQKRKMRKSLGKNISEFERAITALSGNLEASHKKNAAFKFTMKRCEFCNFKSESALAMANHYETPHMNGALYKCNFCTFEIRNATEILYHMEAIHNIKARLIKPLPYHQCPNCGFEDNGKAKLARHQPVCAKKFRPEVNLAPPNDWEAPARIPRIKPRHGLVGTATAYQAMAAQAAAQKAAMVSLQQQQAAAQARSMQAAALAAQVAAKQMRGRAPVPAAKPGINNGVQLRVPNPVRNAMPTNVVLPNNYQLPGTQIMQSANALAKKTLSGQPSISITPLPRQSVVGSPNNSPSSSSGKGGGANAASAGLKPGQSPTGNKAQFVICEICDGYIKDLEQLRNHMQWMHKVKIHPKMIYNRPPLNCQKCQFRFFTDQGLERHLLGSHGLVTSSMQEAANKGKDAGRCPVCGRMYQWKLLNHVSRDHHMTLKPAHLSYKCTVCTATFGMYKQFETHVYTAHSTVARKAIDGKKATPSPGGNAGGSASSASGSGQRSAFSVSNDSLLKPLKINDEITIIPQPASKPRITNMESHVID